MNSFSDELEKLSYAMGMNMGEYLSHTPRRNQSGGRPRRNARLLRRFRPALR